jgi:hypothetical protein
MPPPASLRKAVEVTQGRNRSSAPYIALRLLASRGSRSGQCVKRWHVRHWSQSRLEADCAAGSQ